MTAVMNMTMYIYPPPLFLTFRPSKFFSPKIIYSPTRNFLFCLQKKGERRKRNKTGSGTYVLDKKACVMMTREAKKRGGMDESERKARKKQHTSPHRPEKPGKNSWFFLLLNLKSYTQKVVSRHNRCHF